MTAKVNTSASASATTGGGGDGAANKKKKVADPCTLFVKFTPPSANITRQHLSNYFSYWGPVNKCSVIRNKQAKHPQQQNEGDGGEDGQVLQENGSEVPGRKGQGMTCLVLYATFSPQIVVLTSMGHRRRACTSFRRECSTASLTRARRRAKIVAPTSGIAAWYSFRMKLNS